MTEFEYVNNVRGIIDELLKNAAHSFGIDFKRLNLTAIETDVRLNFLTRQRGVGTLNKPLH